MIRPEFVQRPPGSSICDRVDCWLNITARACARIGGVLAATTMYTLSVAVTS
jgi:hypothetical protein